MTDTKGFMPVVFVGVPVSAGTSSDHYSAYLMEGETVEMEFKGVRDGAALTDRRLIVYNRQGITGKKVEIFVFPWRTITAFKVENSGMFDLDAELRIAGSGFGWVELHLGKGTDVNAVAQYLQSKIFP